MHASCLYICMKYAILYVSICISHLHYVYSMETEVVSIAEKMSTTTEEEDESTHNVKKKRRGNGRIYSLVKTFYGDSQVQDFQKYRSENRLKCTCQNFYKCFHKNNCIERWKTLMFLDPSRLELYCTKMPEEHEHNERVHIVEVPKLKEKGKKRITKEMKDTIATMYTANPSVSPRNIINDNSSVFDNCLLTSRESYSIVSNALSRLRSKNVKKNR